MKITISNKTNIYIIESSIYLQNSKRLLLVKALNEGII